jgi:recombination protein RecA
MSIISIVDEEFSVTNNFMKDIHKELGESDFNQDVSGWLSTGVLPLNKAISGRYDGGIPMGRVTEISGLESTGKTLIAQMVMNETQKIGGLAVFLDYEHSFSISRARQVGMSDDANQWFYKQPENAEKGFEIAEFIAKKVRDNDKDIPVTIVFDSIAAMSTQSEVEASYGNMNMNTHTSLAKFLATALKLLVPVISKTNVTILFLNQIKDSPGKMFGPSTTTPGGKAMKYHASVRIEIAKGKPIEENKEIIGINARVKTIKNKVYAPFKECEYRGSFTEGIDLVGTHIDYAAKIGLLGNSKGWVEWNGEKMRRADLTSILKSDKEQYEKFLELFVDDEINPETGEVVNA